MRILYQNLIDLAATVLTAGTADPSFPVTNLAQEHRSNPYRTGITIAGETVVIDLGSAMAVTAVILLDHTLTNSDTNIKLEGNATNSWGAPSFSQALTYASGTIIQVFSSQSFRWWRLSFTKSAAGETRDIGRMFLGTYYAPTDNPSDATDNNADLTQIVRTEGGQIYADVQSGFRTKEVDFEAIPQTQRDAFRTFADYVGIHTSFWIQIDETLAGEFPEALYCKLSEKPTFKPHGFYPTGGLAWDTTLKLEEQL